MSGKVEIQQTEFFAQWLVALRDTRARARIRIRIDRLRLGLPGDTRAVGAGVSEMRVHYGQGYRVYMMWEGPGRAILLAGGDKSSQARDIPYALRLAKSLREDR